MMTSNPKHIDIKYHYILDLVKQASISITLCSTFNMLAELLTQISLPSLVPLNHARRILSDTYAGQRAT